MVKSVDEVYRDFSTDGVPSSGAHEPVKADIRELLTSFEAFVDQGGNSSIFTTRANLYANLAYAANTLAWVVQDTTTAYNGIYQKQGASGAGSWTRVADLPYSFIRMADTGAGTANAIQVTSTIPTSSSVLRIANVFEANTGNVTISENGSSAKSLLTASGNQIPANGLLAGMMIAYLDNGTNYRLITDQASAAIVAAAEAAQVAAAASAAEAAALAAGVDLPAVASNTMLVDNAAGTERESKTFAEVRTLLNVPQRDEILPPENFVRNGNFNYWRLAASQTGSGILSTSDWFHFHNGITKTTSRQSFTLGQLDVPGQPQNFCRTVVTTSAGATNYANSTTLLGRYRDFGGKTYTLTFWAKSDSAKDIAIGLEASLGTGGSPSTNPTPIVNKSTLSTSWQKFSYLVNIPSLSGLTFGTNDNDKLELLFWYNAGSSFNSRTATLGQQSGTFDIARVSLVASDFTDAADPWPDFASGSEMVNSLYVPGKNNIQINYDFYRSPMTPLTTTTVSATWSYPGSALTSSAILLRLVRRKLVYARWVLVWTPNNASGPGTAVRIVSADNGPSNVVSFAAVAAANGTTPITAEVDVTSALASLIEENRLAGLPSKQLITQLFGDGTNSPQVYASWLETVWDVDPD